MQTWRTHNRGQADTENSVVEIKTYTCLNLKDEVVEMIREADTDGDNKVSFAGMPWNKSFSMGFLGCC
jgi:hypothetical protein